MLKLDEAAIVPFFQPIVCVSTSTVLGYEVLGRLKTGHGFASLGPFFHDSQISDWEKVRVDRIVRYKALERFEQLKKDYLLFLNIQPGWLLPHHDCSSLPTLDLLDQFGLDGSRIIIEICESGFCEETKILASLVDRYRQSGCKIALDDFGQGFTDIDRIISLKPDYIKMPMNLTGLGEKADLTRYLLESMGNLCQKIGLNLILEEVETIEQLQMGLGTGARYFQGHYFSKPVADFTEWESLHVLIDEGLTRCLEAVKGRQNIRFQTAEEINRVLNLMLKGGDNSPEPGGMKELIEIILGRAPSNWLRIYCCQANGYQVTSNYFRENDNWRIQPEYMGRNWSWRPYFYPNVSQALLVGKGVLSDTYWDMETGKKVWTFTYPLQEDCLLFIDSWPEEPKK